MENEKLIEPLHEEILREMTDVRDKMLELRGLLYNKIEELDKTISKIEKTFGG